MSNPVDTDDTSEFDPDEFTVEREQPGGKLAPTGGIPAVLQQGMTGTPITAEVFVGGKPKDLMAAPPPCPHLRFGQLVEVQNLVDADGRHAAWRATLKVRCVECGVPFRFVRKSNDGRFTGPDAALSDDRLTIGALIEPIPAEERWDGDANWPMVGEPGAVQQWNV